MVFRNSARRSVDGPAEVVTVTSLGVWDTVPFNVVDDLPSCFGAMEEVLDLLSEKVLPNVNGGHGDKHDVA